MPIRPLSRGLERDDVLAVGQQHPYNCDHVHLADRFADDGEGVVPDLPVWTKVVGTDDVAGIDFFALPGLVDLDGPRRFQRDVFELLLGHLDVGVGVDPEAFTMSSFGASSPVSASTRVYLMR